MTRTITSLEGYIRKISKVTAANNEVLLYRGHSDRINFKLVPSVLREDKYRDSEHVILRELVASHPAEFVNDDTALEQLARVQHYSLPTRLLDLTWNPLAGLFFACNENDGTPGEVIVVRVQKDSVKYYDSDTVSCLANLAHLSKTEKDQINFDVADEAFNSQLPVDRLVQFIRAEKPQFRPSIRKADLKTAVVVKPKLNSRRILAQSGAFLLVGLGVDLENGQPPGISIERIYVNGNKKAKIRTELDRMAINSSSMFPEIEKAALYIKSKI